MTDSLPSVEALQREIDRVTAYNEAIAGISLEPERKQDAIHLAALELVKADASRHCRQGYRDECDQEINDARDKLYEALKS
jgi:hypothetical protein